MSNKRKPKPGAWTYKDEFRHIRHTPYLRQKAQAAFRNEYWGLTFEEFCKLWPDELWYQRGNYSECYCMTMIDHSLGWFWDNVMIMTRKESGARNNKMRNV